MTKFNLSEKIDGFNDIDFYQVKRFIIEIKTLIRNNFSFEELEGKKIFKQINELAGESFQ